MSGWPFGELQPLGYDLILADPATRFETYSAKGEGKSPQAQYGTMTWEELAAMPVAQLGRGDCILKMWACWPTLRQSLQLLDDWGFRYVTGGAWHKRTKHGKSAFGTGYVLRSACEPYLIGTLGSPATANNLRNIIETEELHVIDAERREHSRKPDEQYDYCQRMAKNGVRFVELFARQRHPGWDAWGHEADKFVAGAAA
ncbi:DNA methyltransferase [Sphingobium sufflavum]|uniref:MT-A70 family methyltransferase n=1 Tax=Sphingobium sufflavum TaxID=1129547 RepID=UPI001F160FCA|nr:MT-A70 family methyltransferase [Sphingobium sufflavum]MCE7797873.1 DNA methyltransferase [Sphingobium sufflavum]